ncbi:hypothetical protein PQR65_05275 [Paraburkholderia nemoris]|uniref:hypothetical protein n=1 Tax=Paraburkholderia nemoris TaxID=2793076 RepID=UPI0038BA1A95
MFQTDQTTAATSLPAPAVAGTQGYFTNGNPGTGVPATIVDADWLNMTTLELCNIVTSAGLTLSKTTYNQVLTALRSLQQTQNGTAFTTAGTAPAFTLTPTPALTALTANQRFRVKFNAAGTTGSNTLNISGLGPVNLMQYGPDGVLIPSAIPSGLLSDVEYNGTYAVVLDPVVSGITPIQPISASVASNALTVALNETALTFRSATLNSGAVTPLSIGTALSLTVPSGATLGSTSGVQAAFAVLALYNGGSPVLGIVNLAGGVDLSETGLISSTAISAAATSSSTVYSTSAITNSPYRVVGMVQLTEATAGTYATAPSLVQGIGGQAFAALQSIGNGQTWQNLTGSRALGTTYYNTTGRPILISVWALSSSSNAAVQVTINGVTMVGNTAATASTYVTSTYIVPPGAPYGAAVSTGTPTLGGWCELR